MKNKGGLLLIILGGLLVLGVIGFYGFKQFQRGTGIHIALVSATTDADGRNSSIIKATKLYIDIYNRKAGVNDTGIVLDIYDDENNPEKATEQAKRIAEGEAVAVIGHVCDQCSQNGGEIYEQVGIPAISPASKGAASIEENDWYFRTIFNDTFQARFLAHYVDNVMQPKSVFIINETDPYGSRLARIFKKSLAPLGIEVNTSWEFDPKDPELSNRLELIVDELKKTANTSPLFIASQIKEGALILKLLKDKGLMNQVITPDVFSSPDLMKEFSEYQKEKLHPGYYTDGIYVAAPTIFDIENEESRKFKERYIKQYGQAPDWKAMFAVDSLKLIIEDIKTTGATGDSDLLKEERKNIRDHLASLTNVVDAKTGMTGPLYFDEKGNSFKPIRVGTYKGINFLPALFQFQTIQDIKEIGNLEESLNEKLILKIDDIYMYKTHIIHTGVDVLEITNLDLINMVYKMDFYLWFRYHQGEIDIGDIEFLNAVKEIKMRAPLDEVIIDGHVYRRYLVSGAFKADFLPTERFDRHILGVSFRHKTLTRNELVYVKDVMGIPDKYTRLEASQILNPVLGWEIDNVAFYQDISKKRSWGNLKYINHKEKTVDHSLFTSKIQVKTSTFSIPRVKVGKRINLILIGMLGFGILVLFYLGDSRKINKVLLKMIPIVESDNEGPKPGFWYSEKEEEEDYEEENRVREEKRERYLDMVVGVIWFLQIIFSVSFFILLEAFFINKPPDEIDEEYMEMIIMIFDILWWVVPFKMINVSIKKFIFDVLERKSGRQIPTLVTGFVYFTFYIFAFLGIVAFVLHLELTSLIATSGVFMMIIGLAVQLNISNVFSGLAINIEHPYRIGDWVQIGEHPEGRVKEINWRTTRLEDRIGCMLCIPNSEAAESMIHNYSLPTEMFYWWNEVHVDPRHDPETIKGLLLKAILAVETRVLKDPMPWTVFAEIKDNVAIYWAVWAAENLQSKYMVRQEVWISIWKHLKRAGITPTMPRQELHLHQHEGIEEEENAIEPVGILKEVDLFDSFGDEDIQYLATRMTLRHFKENEAVVKQGDTGDSLFILVDGITKVDVHIGDDQILEVARLNPGKVFGEMALLTGEARTADVVTITDAMLFEITKKDISPLLKTKPDLSRALGKKLMERKVELESKKDEFVASQENMDSIYDQMMGKINRFFSVS